MRNRRHTSGDIVIPSFNAKNRTVSDEHLTEIFSMIGEDYGFDRVTAAFAPLRDLTGKWVRIGGTIEFQITDYLDRAPDAALESLAETIFARIRGKESDYGEAFIQYLNDEDVMRSNQRDFLDRSNLSGQSVGRYHDLVDCVDRLRGQKLIPNDLECVLTWDSQPSLKAAGSSVLQRVVWVNSKLDSKGVPEHVLDFCVYAMMCPLIIGFSRNPKRSLGPVMSMAMQHPMAQQSLDWLESNDMFLFD